MNRLLTPLLWGTATILGGSLILTLPLHPIPRLTLRDAPQYAAKLTLVKGSGTSQVLQLDTQGQEVSVVALRLEYSGAIAESRSGCITTPNLALRCSFTQTTQEQLIPLLVFATPPSSVQILPGSIVESNGIERLRQLPLLTPTL